MARPRHVVVDASLTDANAFRQVDIAEAVVANTHDELRGSANSILPQCHSAKRSSSTV